MVAKMDASYDYSKGFVTKVELDWSDVISLTHKDGKTVLEFKGSIGAADPDLYIAKDELIRLLEQRRDAYDVQVKGNGSNGYIPDAYRAHMRRQEIDRLLRDIEINEIHMP